MIIPRKARVPLAMPMETTINPNILKLNEIEAFTKLATSPNAKTVITDGKGSVLNLLED
jgi:hypothetical protein